MSGLSNEHQCMLGHSHEPLDIASRGLDTTRALKCSGCRKSDSLRRRLHARKRETRLRVESLPKAEKKAVPQLQVGAYAYHQVERDSRSAIGGMKTSSYLAGPILDSRSGGGVNASLSIGVNGDVGERRAVC